MAIKKLSNSFERLGIVRKVNEIIDMVNNIETGEGGGFDPAQLKQVVVAGGASDAELSAAGISTTDKVIGVTRVHLEAEKVKSITDVTAKISIAKAGKIKVSEDTTGDTLLLTFYEVG